MKKETEPEKISDFMFKNAFPCAEIWRETRGRKKKYSLAQIKPGKVFFVSVEKTENSKNIQTAISRAAKDQKIKISTQNYGTHLLIKGMKKERKKI